MNIIDYISKNSEHSKHITKLTIYRDATKLLLDKAEKAIKDVIATEIELSVNKLINEGWKKFVFISNDVEFSVMKIEISFIFNKDIPIDQFSNAEFKHGTGNFRSISFSKKKVVYKNEDFESFERWLNSLKQEDYIIIEEKD